MDLSKMFGRVFVAGCFGLAAIDGIFRLFVLGVVAAIATGKRSHTLASETSQAITEFSVGDWEDWAAATHNEKGHKIGKEERDERKHKAKAAIAMLEKRAKTEAHGNSTLAQLMGLGGFAHPAAGLAYVAGTLASSAPQEDTNDEEDDEALIEGQRYI